LKIDFKVLIQKKLTKTVREFITFPFTKGNHQAIVTKFEGENFKYR